MNVLFLTLQYDTEKESEYLERSSVGLQGAINAYQNGLIKGFAELDCNVKIMNTLPFAPFPKYKQLFFSTKEGKMCGFDSIEIGYMNLPLIKQWCRTYSYKKQVKKWIKETKGEKCIVAYSLYLPFEKVFRYIKIKYPDVKTCMICADLPCEFGILPKNPIKSALYKHYGKKTLSYSEFIDSYVLLTENMKDPLSIDGKPYTVIEGVADKSNMQIVSSQVNTDNIILYTGTLDAVFGVLDLVHAFSMLKGGSYKLWICGAGDAQSEVTALAELDDRITYFGYVSKREIVELQNRATILVNPRKNNMEYTKYSFPSKTMEYMLSGKPVLMYKLSGIPNEYDEHLFYFSGDTIEQMSADIERVCLLGKNELLQKGKTAQQFILNNKISCYQAKKLFALLERIL